MKNNPQKKILRQDGFPIGAEMAKKRYSSAGTTTPFLKQLILTILLFAILPVSALAAGEDAPGTLYVGNQRFIVGSEITYWTTDADGKLTQSAADQSWNVKYDPSTATLTLKDAKISGSFHQYNNPFTAGIYAQCSSNQPVALTIELIGTNTITGNYGIYVDAQQGQTVGTNASLLIQNSGDDGSLGVSGFNYGIYVKSGTGNASLTIKDASVVASSSSSYDGYAGVCVQSGSDATSSPKLSLAVDGGSLTASGTEGNDGIQFYVGDPSATNATTSLTVSNNAIVRAENGIKAERVDKPTPSGTGIVFDGTEGTVYGDVTLQEDLEIGEGESLTIPQGASLTVPEGTTLTNKGTIIVYGELTGKVEGEGEGSIPITGITLDQTTLSLDVDETATLQATIKPSIATDKDLTWSSSDSDVATVENGVVTAQGEGKATITVTTQDGGYTATCEVTVKQHTHSLTKTDYKAPTCTEDGNIEYWTCSVCGKYFSDEAGTTEISLDETVIYATGHHYVNGTCTECGADDPDYVEPEPEPEPEPTYYRVDLRPVEGATVILSADEVEEGGTLTFTIEIAEGYVADDLMVTVSQGIGKAVEVKPDEAGVYTVKEVDGLVTITVYGVTEEPATAIERVETLRIYAAEGILHVETPTCQRVTIVSMAGALIADGEQEGARIYRDLNAGVYIVRVGDYATKVRVE